MSEMFFDSKNFGLEEAQLETQLEELPPETVDPPSESELSDEEQELSSEEDLSASESEDESEETVKEEEGIEFYKKQAEESTRALEVEKRKAEDWVKAIQSNADRNYAEMQKKLEDFMSVADQKIQQDAFLDDDGDEVPLTASQVRELMKEERKREESSRQKMLEEQEKRKVEVQQQAETWLFQQPDHKEVIAFFKKNNLDNDPDLKSLPDITSRYWYIKAKKIESDSKRSLQKRGKKNIPPTGNSGKKFSSKGSLGAQGSNLLAALERKRNSIRSVKGDLF